MGAASTTAVSLGVLPVREDSPKGEDEQGYFARGFVEDLIIDLSRFSNLAVIDPHSAFSDSLEGLNDGEVAGKLGTEFLLKTSIRKQPGGLRLNAQLVSPEAGRVLWAERYEAPDESIFEIQDSVVGHVTSAIAKHIELATLHAARQKTETDLAAYDCWLRGSAKLRNGSVQADVEAREYFRRALKIDPHYARAYVGLSLSHFNFWSCQAWELADARECFAYEYAREALKIDNLDHIAHYVMGRILLFRRDFERGEQHIDRSLDLNARDSDILVQIGFCKTALGKPEMGSELYQRAVTLNPLHDPWYFAFEGSTN